MVKFEYDRAATLTPIRPFGPYVATGAVPMRLRICGRDVLTPDFDEDRKGEPGWAPLDLISFTTYGLLHFRLVQRFGVSFYPLDETGESLLFKAEGDLTLVHSTLTEITVGTSFDKLNNAWTAFGSEVQAHIAELDEEFARDPIWAIADQLDKAVTEADWDRLLVREFVGHERCFDAVDAVC